MNEDARLERFLANLRRAAFSVRHTGDSPIIYHLEKDGSAAGRVRLWPPDNIKFNEVRDAWRDCARSCWANAQVEAGSTITPAPHWLEVERLLRHFAPYRNDFLDFADLANALIHAFSADGLQPPNLESIRYDFSAIQTAAESRGLNGSIR